MIRIAVVEAHAAAKDGRPLAAVTVRYPDLVDHEGAPLVAGPFQVVQPFAGAEGPHALRLPAVGQIVVVAPLPNGSGWDAAGADGPTDCVVLGAVYPDAAPLPTDDPAPESDVVVFPDGTRVEYHPADGVTLDTPLPVRIRSADAVRLGDGDGQPFVLHDDLRRWLGIIVAVIKAHVHPGSGVPPLPATVLPLDNEPPFASDHTFSS